MDRPVIGMHIIMNLVNNQQLENVEHEASEIRFRIGLSNTSGHQYEVPHPSHTLHAMFDCIADHLLDTLSRHKIIKYRQGELSTIVTVVG